MYWPYQLRMAPHGFLSCQPCVTKSLSKGCLESISSESDLIGCLRCTLFSSARPITNPMLIPTINPGQANGIPITPQATIGPQNANRALLWNLAQRLQRGI